MLRFRACVVGFLGVFILTVRSDGLEGHEPALDTCTATSNTTAVGLVDRSPSQATQVPIQPAIEPFLKVSLFGQRQHVGFLTGETLRYHVSECLHDLCWGKAGFGDEACHTDRHCRIENIAYNARGRLASEAHMQVRVKSASFPVPENKTIALAAKRDALIDQVASTYKAMTERKRENCYFVTLSGKDEFMCNVGETVWVDVAGPKGGHLYVSVRFNGRTLEGPYDCEAAYPEIHHYLWSVATPKMNTILGRDPYEWTFVDVSCYDHA